MSEEAHTGETFFTNIGCMDGRVQKAVNKYASLIFGAEYADTITKAGLDGLLAKEVLDPDVFESVKNMLLVSVDKHHSLGIVVHGHQECAGNPVDEKIHKHDIKKSVDTIKKMLEGRSIEIKGVYVKIQPRAQIIEVV